jgi:hypothetical protein
MFLRRPAVLFTTLVNFAKEIECMRNFQQIEFLTPIFQKIVQKWLSRWQKYGRNVFNTKMTEILSTNAGEKKVFFCNAPRISHEKNSDNGS